MLDGVFDKRLQEQARDLGCQGVRRHVPFEMNGARVTDFEDLGVATQPLHLFAERAHRALILQRITQQVPERDNQLARLARVGHQQTGDSIQGVEQKVRVEVGTQACKLSLLSRPLDGQHAGARQAELHRKIDGQKPECQDTKTGRGGCRDQRARRDVRPARMQANDAYPARQTHCDCCESGRRERPLSPFGPSLSRGQERNLERDGHGGQKGTHERITVVGVVRGMAETKQKHGACAKQTNLARISGDGQHGPIVA